MNGDIWFPLSIVVALTGNNRVIRVHNRGSYRGIHGNPKKSGVKKINILPAPEHNEPDTKTSSTEYDHGIQG